MCKKAQTCSQVCYQQVYNVNPHNVTPTPPLVGSWLLFSRFRGKALSHSHTRARARATKRHKTSDQRQTHRGRHVQSITMAPGVWWGALDTDGLFLKPQSCDAHTEINFH